MADTALTVPFVGGSRWTALIDGGDVDDQGADTIAVLDPATGRTIAVVARGGRPEVDRAVAAARAAFTGEWRAWTADRRSQVLWEVARRIDEHAEQLARLETLNQGMPISAAYASVAGVARTFRYYAGAVERIDGRSRQLATRGGGFFAYTSKEPVGVVAAITPWNAPLSQLSWKLAPALASGCTVVVKPAEQTPLTAIVVARLCREAGVPPGVVNLVTGPGDQVGAALAAHRDVDKISFTGSTETGRAIVAAAMGNVKKVSLELGGKSPVLIFSDADIDAAIAGAGDAIFRNAGQACTAGSRLLVHRSVYSRVIEGVAQYARSLRVGAGDEADVQMGPLISARHRERVDGYVRSGTGCGAELVTGGESIDRPGFFYEPTVLSTTRADIPIMTEEIFGPVVAAMPFGDEDEAIALANGSDFGLAGSVWTGDISRAHRVAGEIRGGRIGINLHPFADVTLPTGGYRQSGWGRELGPEGLEQFLETKTVMTPLSGETT